MSEVECMAKRQVLPESAGLCNCAELEGALADTKAKLHGMTTTTQQWRALAGQVTEERDALKNERTAIMNELPNKNVGCNCVELEQARARAESDAEVSEYWGGMAIDNGKLLVAAEAELEQARVQLAGCLTAAEGAIREPAKQGDYGWSLAYQRVLELRAKITELEGDD